MPQRAGITRARAPVARRIAVAAAARPLLVPIGLVVWIYAGRAGGRARGATGAGGRRRVQGRDRGRAAQGPAAARLAPPDQLRAAQAAGAARRRRRKPEQKLAAEEGGGQGRREAACAEARARGRRRRRRRRSRSSARPTRRSSTSTTTRRSSRRPTRSTWRRRTTAPTRRRAPSDTNLQKAQKGEAAASDKSDRDDPEPGADKEKIAELEDKKSALGRRAPDVTPHDNPEVGRRRPRTKRAKSLLALRDPRQAAARADARDRQSVAAQAPPTGRSRSAAPGARRAQRSVAPANERQARQAGAVATRTSNTCSAPTPRRSAGWRRRSGRPGRASSQQRLARVQRRAGELHPRGQAGQPDRAQHARRAVRRVHRAHAPEHPQAVGLRRARGLGRAAGSSPLNNSQPATTLEMVLNRDGTVDKVTRRAPSGYLPFDAAAIDVVYNAGAVSRSAARDPLGRRQDLRPLELPPRRAPVRHLGRRLLHPRQPARGRRPPVDAEAPIEAPVRWRPPPRGRTADRRRRAASSRPPRGRRDATRHGGGLRRLRRFDDGRHRREDAAPGRGGRDGRGATTATATASPRARGAAAAPPARARPIRRRARSPNAGSRRSPPATSRGWPACRALPFKTSGKDVTEARRC